MKVRRRLTGVLCGLLDAFAGRHCFLMGVLMLTAWPALAHRPYERPAGAFKREDGTAISIVRHYIDGILFTDPVSIQFRLPNGTNVAQTDYIFDAVVRSVPSAVEVYQFRTTWVPVASRIERFDGKELHDITNERRLTSVLVHFSGHWIAYLVISGLVVFFVAVHHSLKAIPKQGWRLAVKLMGYGVFGFIGIVCAYDILVFEPVSPLIVAFIAAGLIAVLRLIRRRHGRLKTA